MTTDSSTNHFPEPDAALPPAERRYRALAEAMPQMVWATDAEGRSFYFNRRWYAYTGLSEAESLGLGFTSALHPDDHEPIRIGWEQARRMRTSYVIEQRFRRYDGVYHWFNGRVMPIFDQSGAIVEWVGTCTDIDEQKRTSELLGFVKHTLDQIHDCVLMFDPTTLRLFYVNQGTVDQLGYSRDELLTMTPLDFKPEFDEDQFRAMLAPLIAGERSLYQFETLHRHKNGHTLPVEITLQYLERNATPAHFVAVVRDISERRRAALALEERNRELDQFAYVTSHDLKAPLRGIANLAQWIEEDLGASINPEICEHLNLLRGRVQRMESLINGLLQYSRVGCTADVIEQVDVGALLREVIDLLNPPAGFRLELADDLPTLWTSRLLLERVFANLLENAIKHSQQANLTVSVTAERIGPLYAFRVIDNGQGIDPRYHERIFGIFQTLASRDTVEGSGMGLALIKKIVGQQGGRIWVDSDVGIGASFTFTWPVHPRRP